MKNTIVTVEIDGYEPWKFNFCGDETAKKFIVEPKKEVVWYYGNELGRDELLRPAFLIRKPPCKECGR